MNLLSLITLLASILAGIPTPTPTPVPAELPQVATPTPRPVEVIPTPTPTPAPPAGDPSVPDEDAYHDAGPVALTVRACVDSNADRRCSLGEGVGGLPIAVVDTQTAAILATAETTTDGIVHADLNLPERAELSIDVPYLALAQTFYPGQRGVEVVVPAVPFPKVLP
jgi:hypothetical protein